MKFQRAFLPPFCALALGVSSCTIVADRGDAPDPRRVVAPLVGAPCNDETPCEGAELCCNGVCVDALVDNAHCGACGAVCQGATTCVGGACGCADPALTQCGNACLDVNTNNANCGACGNACPGATTCVGGACGCADPALTACGSSCVDVTSNNANCGACGTVCQGATTCVGGACGCADPALTACGSSCVDVMSNNANCGACGNACTGATTCLGGACGCADPALTRCGNACLDVNTNNANCGACGNACAPGVTCSNRICGGCSGAASVSFSATIQPILTASCALSGCHENVDPAIGMTLAAGSSYASLVNMPAVECGDGRMRVAPGNPGNSYIVHKLTATNICAGSPMPLGGFLLDTEITTISSWICGGAPNN